MADLDMLNSCLRKQPYATLDAARARFKEFREDPKTIDPDRLKIYRCEYCDQFHLGHLPVVSDK